MMQNVQSVIPFRAWRYNQRLAGPLSELVAPPYDVISPDLQPRLYARSRYNVVRVDLGMTTPSDNDCDNRYTRSAAQLSEWKKAGILVHDDAPSITFARETFAGPDGRLRNRHGFLALIKLHDFSERVVFPHEFTLSGPKEDRFRLMESTRMSLSPVFLLYDLPGDAITGAWNARISTSPSAFTVNDDAGTVTELWPTSDGAILDLVGQNLAAARFIIADGHHRYETALRYRDHRREREGAECAACDKSPDRGSKSREKAYEYALAYFSNMADPGLAIYGTHRLLSGLPAAQVAALPETLAGTFTVERLTSGSGLGADIVDTVDPDAPSRAIAAYLDGHPEGGAFGLAGPGLDAIYGVALADRAALDAAVAGHSAAYRDLDVTILHSLVLEKLLGMTGADMAAEKYVTYVKDWNEAIRRLRSEAFQAAFFMNPTRLEQIREVAMGGERMPQKATFFYPKLPTGLVFHDLGGHV